MAKENSILESCISKYKEENGDLCSNLEDSDIFEMFAAEQILKDYDLDMEEISSGLVGGGEIMVLMGSTCFSIMNY